MNSLTLAVLAVMTVLAQSFTLSTLTSVSLTLMTFYQPANCFFGFFRRRGSVPSVIEESTGPQGPVETPAQLFQQNGYFNPLTGGNGFMPSFPNIPGFSGFLPFTRFQPLPSSWSTQNRVPPIMPQQTPANMPQFPPDPSDFQEPEKIDGTGLRFDDQPQINTEEAESFFTLLAETDENKCISRLVCELGADPSTGGELGSTISDIIGSLTNFPSGSKVSDYSRILNNGRARGLEGCASEFSTCDEESYMLMKNSQSEQDAEANENS